MEELELEIVANGMDGEGIAKLNNKVYFVDGATAGDVCLVKIISENKNFCKGKVINFIKKSEERVEPKCKYYNVCGGCNLQHLNYEKQLEIKKDNIASLLRKSKLDAKVNNVISSEKEFCYRNKLTLYLSKNNKLSFFERKSNSFVEIDGCCLVDDNFNKLIVRLNNFLKNSPEINNKVLKSIMIRKINEQFLINFVLTKKIIFTKIINFLKLNKFNFTLYYCINTKNNLQTYPYFKVYGDDIFSEEMGINYPIFPLSFIQINNKIKEEIYKNILNIVKNYDCVIDAYSGAGLLSALISKQNKKVYAIEIDESASNACVELCKINNIKNVKSICGRCEDNIPKILNEQKIDCAVLDPARKGVDALTLQSIKNNNIETIVYLSCNPATLCRDLKILCEDEKYIIEFVQPYDMFPQTSEVETLVVLNINKN